MCVVRARVLKMEEERILAVYSVLCRSKEKAVIHPESPLFFLLCVLLMFCLLGFQWAEGTVSSGKR